MKTETLQVMTTLNEANAQGATRALQSVEGVSKVAIAATGNSIDIAFDEDVTSLQVLRTSLQRIGVEVKKPAHGEEGMCCGSCS